MNNNLFENAKFNYAWEMSKDIVLFEKNYKICVSADAYFESEEITVEQKNSYAYYLENEEHIISKIEKALIKDAGNKNDAIKRYVPTTLKLKRNGDSGFLFDDKENFEDGLAVTIPEIKLLSLNEYL